MTFHVPNISPDSEGRIGDGAKPISSRRAQGHVAIRHALFPAFPYASYQHAKVEDIRDLFRLSEDAGAGERQAARP